MQKEISLLKASFVGMFIAFTIEVYFAFGASEPVKSIAYYGGIAIGGALMGCGVAWFNNRRRRP